MTPDPGAQRSMARARPEPDPPPVGARTRVLHVVESLGRGAVETWLVRMLRHAREAELRLDWTFYCTLPGEAANDPIARELGARVMHSPVPVGRQGAFGRALREEVRRGGYDVLHCHHDLVSGFYLLATAGLPVRKRIVHAHNADEEVLTSSAWKQRLYRPLLRQACLALADETVGISQHTLDTQLGGRSRRPDRDRVHYYGVDPAAFEGRAPDRAEFRRALGLASDARILLFAGRLVPEKRPSFAVEVLAALRHQDPSAVAVFAGSGSEEAGVRARAAELQVADAVRLLGWRGDVAYVMRCCDWFILPRPERPMEGFGLAVVEAQLAGLRLLLSRGIPDDPLLPTAIFRRLPLSAPPATWAAAACELMAERAPSAGEARRALAGSPMDMDAALADLLRLYA